MDSDNGSKGGLKKQGVGVILRKGKEEPEFCCVEQSKETFIDDLLSSLNASSTDLYLEQNNNVKQNIDRYR